MIFRACRGSMLLMPVVLLLQAILLAFVDVVSLTAGSGSIDNNDHLPRLSDHYIVRIEADEYSTTVGGDAERYQGLPDSHDFSKAKDWFAIYPSLYCSGYKSGRDGTYTANYCSPWPGKELFDLQWLWRVWGVDLVSGDYIGRFPQAIFASLVTSTIATALSIVLGLLSFCSHRCLVLATATAWIALISTTALAASSQTFVARLTSAHIPVSEPGTGRIGVTPGAHHVRNAWIGTGVALAAALLCVFVLVRERRARRSAGARKGRRRGVGSSTGYRNLGSPGGEEGEQNSSSYGEQMGLASRSVSPAPGLMPRFEGGKAASVETAYEPMRHRGVGN